MAIFCKLKGHKYANCDVKIHKNYIELWSYDACVISYDIEEEKMTIFRLYSIITRRHISWFISQYFGDVLTYKNIKYAYDNMCMIDIKNKCYIDCHTGEVVKCGF